MKLSAKVQICIMSRGSQEKQGWLSRAHVNLRYILFKDYLQLFRPIASFPVVASFLTLLLPSYVGSQPALEKVNAAYVSTGGGFAVTWIAKEANLFQKYGLDVQLIRIPGGPRLVQATIGGDVHLAHVTGVSTINAIVRGAELVLLAQTSRGYSGHLMVRSSINSFNDVRKKRIGVPQYGSAADSFLREGLKRWNLEPDRDVAILQLGGTTETFAALASGRVDGAVISTELALRAGKAGFRDLFYFGNLGVKELSSVLIAKRSYVTAHEDLVVKFLKAFVEAIYLYKTNKDFSLKVLQKYTRNEDFEILSAVREEYIKNMDPIPYPKEEDFMGSLSRLGKESEKMEAKIKTISANHFLETKYLRELENSGFVKALYDRREVR